MTYNSLFLKYTAQGFLVSYFFHPQIPHFGEIVLNFLPPASLHVSFMNCYRLFRTLVRPADLQLQESLFLFSNWNMLPVPLCQVTAFL